MTVGWCLSAAGSSALTWHASSEERQALNAALGEDAETLRRLLEQQP